MITLRSLLAAFTVALLTSCASLPPQADRIQTHAVTDTQNTRLAIAFTPQEQQHPDESAFHLLPDAVDALVARLVLAEAADRTLDLQYYIWHDDLTGRALASAVMRAADRGVRVRILLDDLGTNADDNLLLALDAHPNVQIRLFNPVANRTFKKLSMATDFFRVNRRMHNKSMIADNQGAILGGRNIGDEYFGASNDVAFGDLDVLVHGPVVHEVSSAFDLFWNSEAAYPIDGLMGRKADPAALADVRKQLDAYLVSEENNPYVVNARARLTQVIHSQDAVFSWGKATLLYDDPAKITRAPGDSQGHLMTQLKALELQPTQQMLVVSPYFVPGKEGVAWLSGLTQKQVRVTVLTNSLAATDVAAVHAGYQRYRKALLEAGVRLYELKPVAEDKTADKTAGKTEDKKHLFGSSKASLHAKTYVFDRNSIFIGSMNLDPRSVELNTEIGVYCESAPAAAQVVDTLEPNFDRIAWRLELRANANGTSSIVWIDTAPDGTVKVLDSEPDVSAMRKAGIWFLSILPIESQL
ncbi:phospholipase D family protein [Paraburkholderia hospita]|uniref:Phospholipase D family protein n=1 Tax=Paraburkholderia hospita TaxID=169430 RepID=A0AAN1MKN6_9BURK|nr:phospholipase D family protein [Paraburkholderia hospita]AUT70539.1 phospholipase D family protein [Paraburkholderia hospita]EIM97870.1 phospholipase D/transphosphatidylase [Paraburkholderia hospita]OUL90905.1 phospholipase D family protein [Paraburkholderia hospita]OUL91072.1 phospholipase D family protein [Paraburkholderia hospita]SEH55771.1 putative cardiolipin synthase [Paraburkholderia hospita]